MAMGVVVFDPEQFRQEYEEFKDKSDPFLTRCFKTATTIVKNSNNAFVQDVEKRKYLLDLLTAHFAELFGKAGRGNANQVGVVASATEGTVSVSFNQAGITKENFQYMQTQYGAIFWEATREYRTMLYFVGRSKPEREPIGIFRKKL